MGGRGAPGGPPGSQQEVMRMLMGMGGIKRMSMAVIIVAIISFRIRPDPFDMMVVAHLR